MLKVSNLNFKYDEEFVLKDVSFDLYPNEITWLQGINGSGKSTLLQILANLLSANGNIEYHHKGDVIRGDRLKEHTIYIPESPYLFDYLTGAENAIFLKNLFQISDGVFEERFYENCKKFSLSDALKKPVKDYSLGMKYKLYLSVMFLRDANILLLDEPFSAIDKSSLSIAVKMIEEVVRNGALLIFSSHIEEMSHSICDNIFRLNGGEVEKIQIG
ncbi:ABC transporter ATP-binding protein [Bacillus vallismortis]|uniref:ATP-binding cassette domain-containing protein n=1 Tax=Bacillus TaxID=1386 RepID=UPI00057BF5A8|nr:MULTISPECIES: ABC transporter ATP-binding protein [Bacillus]PJZ00762.1 ABC transporter ATP-binding protein [Bacillus vallismortis]